MSCNSAIYCVNSTGQAYQANSQIPFGHAVRRYGCNCGLDGDAIVLRGSGYYLVDAVLVTTPTAAGEITAQLLGNGVPIPGASATVTATAAGDYVTLPISCMVRNCGPCCDVTLTLVVDAAHTLDHLATRAVKS